MPRMFSETQTPRVTGEVSTPFALTVSATGVNKVYDATTNATVTLSDNRTSGDTLTTSYASASFPDKNVGEECMQKSWWDVEYIASDNGNACQ